MKSIEEKNIEPTIGDFILSQEGINYKPSLVGNYYHYNDVCELLIRYKKKFDTEQYKWVSDRNIKPEKDVFVLCETLEGEYEIAKWSEALFIWQGKNSRFMLRENEVKKWKHLPPKQEG